MPAPLKSLWELRAVAAGAPAAVRVRNLRTTVTGPQDAWGRSGKPQPASISATATFHHEFRASSHTDSVASDTVHYGLLSKAILSALDRPSVIAGDARAVSERLLATLSRELWKSLTATDFDTGDHRPEITPFFTLVGVRTIEIQVHLPKATLLGGGVSVTHMAEFNDSGGMVARARALRIHDMRVPTLIGVNSNERRAKQVVVASLELDHVQMSSDVENYPVLAEKLVEVMSDSSFETLEALANRIGGDISSLLHGHSFDVDEHLGYKPQPDNWRLHISLEKPIAITLADAACVELKAWTRQMAAAERLKEDEVKHER